MKIAPLLAQYLYSKRHLELPGIGIFLLDSSFNPEPDLSKNAKPVIIEGITFENNTFVKESPDLIQFISDHTGKIKPLAAADFESHLELAKEIINIGKAFLLEGIGSLSKMQSGGFAFSPGYILTEKLIEHTTGENITTAPIEDSTTDYKNIFSIKKEKVNWKKPTAILLLLVGIVLAIWGGYIVYKKSTAKKETTTREENIIPSTQKPSANQSTEITDTSTFAKTSVNTIIPATSIPSGNFKFIVEIANKERGLKRFNTLKGYGLNIQMETKDSVNFKLFFILPANIADTARMVDSLKKIYTPGGNTAFIEK